MPARFHDVNGRDTVLHLVEERGGHLPVSLIHVAKKIHQGLRHCGRSGDGPPLVEGRLRHVG